MYSANLFGKLHILIKKYTAFLMFYQSILALTPKNLSYNFADEFFNDTFWLNDTHATTRKCLLLYQQIVCIGISTEKMGGNYGTN